MDASEVKGFVAAKQGLAVEGLMEARETIVKELDIAADLVASLTQDQKSIERALTALGWENPDAEPKSKTAKAGRTMRDRKVSAEKVEEVTALLKKEPVRQFSVADVVDVLGYSPYATRLALEKAREQGDIRLSAVDGNTKLYQAYALVEAPEPVITTDITDNGAGEDERPQSVGTVIRQLGQDPERRPNVIAGRVRELMREGEWTAPELAAKVPAGPAQVRNALKELVTAGDITELGPREGGTGRAPMVYALKKGADQ